MRLKEEHIRVLERLRRRFGLKTMVEALDIALDIVSREMDRFRGNPQAFLESLRDVHYLDSLVYVREV